MYHLFQATNASHSEGVKRFCLGMRQVFPDSCVWVDGEKSEKEYFPNGPIDANQIGGVFQKMKHKKNMAQLLQPIPAEKLLLTDSYSHSFIDKSHAQHFEIIQILDSFPGEKQIQLKADKMSSAIAFSQTIANAWNPYYSGTIDVIPPPHPDPVPKEVDAHQSFIVGVIADLDQHSGVETVIQALHRNREILPQITVILVGDGPEKKRLIWLVEHLHLRQRIQFVTSKENYHGFLENFDVVVFPDEWAQGYNPILVDAMAQGIPVIASSVGYNEEIIEPGKNGLLFEPQNSHTLSGHLLNLYNNPDWRDYYKQKGPQFVRDYFSLTKLKVL